MFLFFEQNIPTTAVTGFTWTSDLPIPPIWKKCFHVWFLGWCSQYVHLSSASPEAWKENFLIPQKSRNAFSMPVPMVAAQFIQHPWNSLPNTPHLQYRWAAKRGTSPLADDDAIQWMPLSGNYNGRLTHQYMIPHRLCYACYLLWAQYVSNCRICYIYIIRAFLSMISWTPSRILTESGSQQQKAN